MAETMAEKYRRTRPKDYDSATAWFAFVKRVDAECVFGTTDLGPIINFSDGSRHLMDRKK